MVTSYLGVVSDQGLLQLNEESEHAALFLARRCYRFGSVLAVLWWATLDRQDAAIIEQLIRLGLYEAALWRLNADAQQLGSLPPSHSANSAA